MNVVFYVAAIIAVGTGIRVVTSTSVVHALLYLVVSLVAVAVAFFTLGAPFAAALEVIINAGAIIVLFVFVVMMLNLGQEATEQERRWLPARDWRAPSVLMAVLIAEFAYTLFAKASGTTATAAITPKQVGEVLFQKYLLVVELASMLLLVGLVGSFHLGRRFWERNDQ